MTPDLAILIPTTPDRDAVCERLIEELLYQTLSLADDFITEFHSPRIEIIVNKDNREKTIGKKRNELIQSAVDLGAKYIAFFDSDDLPGKNYIKNYMACIAGNYDCCELYGSIYFSGKLGKPFHHSIEYKDWYETQDKYCRTPNHLNCMKLSLVKDFKFKGQNFGEDAHWSIDISKAGVLKTMYQCKDIMYHYFTGTKGTQTELNYAKSLGV